MINFMYTNDSTDIILLAFFKVLFWKSDSIYENNTFYRFFFHFQSYISL